MSATMRFGKTMKRNEIKIHASAALLLLLLLGAMAATASGINIDLVSVDNVANPNDLNGYGGVAYGYAIGKYEVTLTQYTAFLNAVAATDTHSLYDPNMSSDANIAGIVRNGSSGNYNYAVSGNGNRPVTYVNWFDAARFTNWLHNGQPNGAQGAGTTESGAYALSGATSGMGFAKNVGSQWWIPSENEWYKAAYYDPSASGPGDDYWLYPTRSENAPGNTIGAAANQVNFYDGADYAVTQSGSYNGSQNYLTAGGEFSASGSYYGTFDQGGNVWEWNDAVISGSRGLRGGSWTSGVDGLRSSFRDGYDPTFDFNDVGFRVASVPEPSIGGLIVMGLGVWLGGRRRSGYPMDLLPFSPWFSPKPALQCQTALPRKISRKSPVRSAFSLIEVLAVLAIAAILIAIAIPALRSMGGGANVGMLARNINGILQVAASEAKAKSMPVWVGFQNRVQGSDHQLVVVTVTSSDGSGSLDAGATPVGKPEIFNSVRLDKISAPYGGRATGAAQLVEATSDATFTLPVAGADLTFKDTILRFAPSGEVTIPPNSDRVIEMGLQPMRGTTVAQGPNTAVIQVTGMTGLARVYQP